MVWLGSEFALFFRCTKASAPEPPGLLIGVSGMEDHPFFSMSTCIRRAILSAPPPAPAMITNSTGFWGSQADADIGVSNIARPAKMNEQMPKCFFIIFIILTPWLEVRIFLKQFAPGIENSTRIVLLG